MTTFYDVLGVEESASEAEVRAAFREQVKRFHGDRTDRADADRRVIDLNAARDVLTEHRERYDALGHEEFVARADVELRCGWSDGDPAPEDPTDTDGDAPDDSEADADEEATADDWDTSWEVGDRVDSTTGPGEDRTDDGVRTDEGRETDRVRDVDDPDSLAPDASVDRRTLLRVGAVGGAALAGWSLLSGGVSLPFLGGGGGPAEPAWSYEVSAGGDVVAAVPAGDRLLVAAETGSVHALAPDGEREWRVDDRDRLADVAVVGDAVYAVGRTTVYAHSLDGGDRRWAVAPFDTDERPRVTDWDGTPLLTAFDPGAEAHRCAAFDPASGDAGEAHALDAAVAATPRRVAGRLLVPGDGALVAYETPVESPTTAGRVGYDASQTVTDLAVDGSRAYFARDPVPGAFTDSFESTTVHAVDAASMAELWTRDGDDVATVAPAADGGTVVRADPSGTACYDDSGVERWTSEALETPVAPAVAGGVAYVAETSGDAARVVGRDATDGDAVFESAPLDAAPTLVRATESTLLVGTAAGRVHAYEVGAGD